MTSDKILNYLLNTIMYEEKLLVQSISGTTEIYTHVSTSNLTNIESPFEMIGIINTFTNRK